MPHYPEKLEDLALLDFESEKIGTLASNTKNTEIGELALFFEENIEAIEDLVLLPLMITAAGPWRSMETMYRTFFQLDALKKLDTTGEPSSAEQIEVQVVDALRDSLKVEEIKKRCTQQAYADMIEYLSNKNTNSEKHVVYRLFSTATANAWTSFECLATDLWITAINLHPSKFATRSGSNINISDLNKSNFDVKALMGSILADNFDFTGVVGIDNAYSKTFEHFEKGFLLKNKPLKNLEKKRHLIIHRLGRIDEKFTKDTDLNLPVGSLLPCEITDLVSDINTVVDSGCSLIKKVDAYITAASIQ